MGSLTLVSRKELFTTNQVFLKLLVTRFEQTASVHYQAISHTEN